MRHITFLEKRIEDQISLAGTLTTILKIHHFGIGRQSTFYGYHIIDSRIKNIVYKNRILLFFKNRQQFSYSVQPYQIVCCFAKNLSLGLIDVVVNINFLEKCVC